jgi:hypothetical protein
LEDSEDEDPESLGWQKPVVESDAESEFDAE